MDPVTIITLVSGMIKISAELVGALRANQDTPEEEKAKLDLLSEQLQSTAQAVAAVELPNG